MRKTILKTLAYADIFDYPLTAREIWEFLIGNTEAGIQAVRKHLMILADSKHLPAGKAGIYTNGELYFLKGREELVKIRKKKEEWSGIKFIIAQKAADKLKVIPTIKLAGITGALAMNNCKEDDDIDLLIITSSDSLWLTRLLIIILCPILGIRRRKPKNKKFKDKVCFNLFLEENHLKIEPENLFSAHEICQTKPIFNKDNTYEKFLRENGWVSNFLPNAKKISNFKLLRATQQISNFKKSRILSFFNDFAFRLQFWYMKPKITVEKVSQFQAFFHPNDLAEKIIREYNHKLALLGLDKQLN